MKISFDFDGTLADGFDDSLNKNKDEIRKIARSYIDSGHEVLILTKRYDIDNKYSGKQNEYLDVHRLASELGINKVIFTNREMKAGFINNLGIDMHFDDDEYEVKLIGEICNSCICVPVEDPYWRDLVY